MPGEHSPPRCLTGSREPWLSLPGAFTRAAHGQLPTGAIPTSHNPKLGKPHFLPELIHLTADFCSDSGHLAWLPHEEEWDILGNKGVTQLHYSCPNSFTLIMPLWNAHLGRELLCSWPS